MTAAQDTTVAELVARSQPAGRRPAQHQLRRRQHLGQGHRRPTRSPAQPVELLWVKGSGGDLGTLTRGRAGRAAAGPAARARRRLPGRRARGRDGRRVRLLPARPGRCGAVDRHRHARPGRRPARRPPAPGLRHRAGDRGRRRGADPGVLRRPRSCGCRGGGPGFQLGLDIAAVKAANPQAIGVHPRRPRHHRLGRHQRGVRGATRWRSSSTAEAFLAEHGRAEPFGAGRRRVRAAARGRAARPRGRAGSGDPRAGLDRPRAGRPLHRQPRSCSTSCRRGEHPRLAALGTSCPDHFLRTKVRPMVLDLPPDAPLERGRRRGCGSCTPPTARTTRAYYERHADADSPAMRGADPAIVLVPGVGHVQLRQGQADRAGGRRVLRQRDQRHARRRGGLDVRADRRGGEVPDRVLGARGGQAAADAEAEAAGRRGSRWSPAAASGIGKAIAQRLAAEGACVVVADLERRQRRRGRGGDRQRRQGRRGHCRRLRRRGDRGGAWPRPVAGVRRRRPGRQQRRPVDLEAAAGDDRARLGPAARRDGQGLVPGLAGGRAGA